MFLHQSPILPLLGFAPYLRSFRVDKGLVEDQHKANVGVAPLTAVLHGNIGLTRQAAV